MTDPRAPELLAMLDSHRPSTELEAQHLALIRGVADSEPQAFSRSWFDPGHITASGFVVHPTRAALAMVEHAKLRRWLQPGGHVEPEDADMVDAARREVVEETGLSELRHVGLIDLDVHTFPRRGDQPEHLHLDVRQAFVATDPTLTASDEATAVAWVPFTEVVEMEESLARPVRRLAALVEAGHLGASG